MKMFITTTTATALLALGCGSSFPVPTQQMADVQSANRSANELGAQNNPKAQLHLKLAEEQMKQAQAAIEDDDNESAERLLMRAKSDAELAVALTREDMAKAQAGKAVDQSNAQKSTNADLGAAQ